MGKSGCWRSICRTFEWQMQRTCRQANRLATRRFLVRQDSTRFVPTWPEISARAGVQMRTRVDDKRFVKDDRTSMRRTETAFNSVDRFSRIGLLCSALFVPCLNCLFYKPVKKTHMNKHTATHYGWPAPHSLPSRVGNITTQQTEVIGSDELFCFERINVISKKARFLLRLTR